MSAKVVWKPYVDYEKEEAWLNSMAAEGWELRHYTWMRYAFDQGVPGRYTYRIQLLADSWASQKSRDYLAFMRDAGIEVVSTYANWVYFRKKTADGPFEVFSDLDSRIAHHRRVGTMFSAVLAALLPAALVALTTSTEQGRIWLAPLGAAEIALVAAVGSVALREFRKAKALERQRQVHE
jgi:hypothetical protein